MNKKIETMKQEILRRGGVIHLPEDLPDAIAEKFLAQVLACPDCRQAKDVGNKHDH